MEETGVIIDQDAKKYTANDKRVFARDEVEARLLRHGPPVGKQDLLNKAENFLSQRDLRSKEGGIWVIESEEGLGASFLLDHLESLCGRFGFECKRWSLNHPQAPEGENFIWLLDDLSKALEENFPSFTDLSLKLKETIHRYENLPGWIVLAGLHKFAQLPEDLQRILRGRSKRFQLKRWSTSEIAEVLEDVLESREIPAFLIQVLEEEGRGIPKKIFQLFQHYLENKLLFDRKGQWRKELFKPTPLFRQEYGEKGGPNEWEAFLSRLGPPEKKLLFFMANLYEPAPQALVEKWIASGFVSQHLHRLKSLGVLGGEEKGPYFISRSGLKRFLLEQGDPEEAKNLHDRLLKMAAQGEFKPFFSNEALQFHRARGHDPRAAAEAWAYFGAIAARRGFSQSAYEYFTKAFDQAPPQDHEKRFEYALERGKCLIAGQRYSEAQAFFESLRVGYASQQEKSPQHFSKINERLGLIELKRGHLAKARSYFQESLKLLEPSCEPLEQYLGVSNFLASLDLMEGNISHAIEEFRRNHEVAIRDLSWERRRILTNNDLGEALLRNGQAREAVAHWETCLEDFQKREDLTPLVRSYYQLSLAYHELHEEDKAYSYLLKALETSRGLQNFEMEIRLYNALANLKKKTDPMEALKSYEKALECAFHHQDPYATAVVLLNLGFLEGEQGHWERMRHCLNQALTYLSGTSSQDPMSASLFYSGSLGLARAHLKLHQPKEALGFAKKAMAFVENHQEMGGERFETLLLLREALEEAGKEAEAERCLRLLEKIAKTPEEQEKLKGAI